MSTKFQVGQMVWFIRRAETIPDKQVEYKVAKGTIQKIVHGKHFDQTFYVFYDQTHVREDHVFSTEEEAQHSLCEVTK